MSQAHPAWSAVCTAAVAASLLLPLPAGSEQGPARCSGRVEIRESIQLTASKALAPGRELVVLKSGAELRSSAPRVEIVAPCDLIIEDKAAILADSEVVLKVAGNLELRGAIVAGDEQGKSPGRIEIQAQSLRLASAALIRATGSRQGTTHTSGGKIWIDVLDSDLEVPAGVLVTTDASASSTAGHITISASGDVVLEGTLSASDTSLGGQGKGGGILLESREGALSIGEAGEVQVVGNDRGGEVALLARTDESIGGQVLAFDRSGSGNGGSIEIVAGGHLTVGGEVDVGGPDAGRRRDQPDLLLARGGPWQLLHHTRAERGLRQAHRPAPRPGHAGRAHRRDPADQDQGGQASARARQGRDHGDPRDCGAWCVGLFLRTAVRMDAIQRLRLGYVGNWFYDNLALEIEASGISRRWPGRGRTRLIGLKSDHVTTTKLLSELKARSPSIEITDTASCILE